MSDYMDDFKIYYDPLTFVDMDIYLCINRDKYLHFSEFDDKFQEILFYKIDSGNIIFESCSYRIKGSASFRFRDFNNVFEKMDRVEFSSKMSKILTDIENNVMITLPKYNDKIKIKDILRFDILGNLSSFECSDYKDYIIKAEELFYINDFLLFDYGTGRCEKDILSIGEHTPDGSYFSKTIIKAEEDILNGISVIDTLRFLNGE